MSIELVRRVEPLRLPRGQIAVLEAIAWFIWDSTGKSDPKSVRQIAHRARYGMRATSGHLATLMADKAITREGRAGNPKGYRYRIEPAWLVMASGSPAGDEATANPCKECAEPLQNVQGLAPEPLQNLQPKSPTVESHSGVTVSAPASPPPHAPIPSPDEPLVVEAQPSRIEAVPASSPAPPARQPSARRIPLPDDWAPPQEVRLQASAEGLDPDEVCEELRDWWERYEIPQVNWTATYRCFIRTKRAYLARHPAQRDNGEPAPRRPWLVAALMGQPVEARP
jgi:hypothetical protein